MWLCIRQWGQINWAKQYLTHSITSLNKFKSANPLPVVFQTNTMSLFWSQALVFGNGVGTKLSPIVCIITIAQTAVLICLLGFLRAFFVVVPFNLTCLHCLGHFSLNISLIYIYIPNCSYILRLKAITCTDIMSVLHLCNKSTESFKVLLVIHCFTVTITVLFSFQWKVTHILVYSCQLILLK